MYKKITKLDGNFATAEEAQEAFALLTQTEEDKKAMARRVAEACDCANIVIVKVSTYQLMVSKDETVDPIVWGYMDQVCTAVNYTIDQLPTGNTVAQYQEYLDTTKASATVAYVVQDKKYAFYEDAQAELPENEVSVFTDTQSGAGGPYPITGDLQSYVCDLRPYKLAQGDGTLKQPTQQDLGNGYMVLRYYMSGESKLTWRICNLYIVYIKTICPAAFSTYTETYSNDWTQEYRSKTVATVKGCWPGQSELFIADRPEVRPYVDKVYQESGSDGCTLYTRLGRLFPTSEKALQYLKDYAAQAGIPVNENGSYISTAEWATGGAAIDGWSNTWNWGESWYCPHPNDSRFPLVPPYYISAPDIAPIEAYVNDDCVNLADGCHAICCISGSQVYNKQSVTHIDVEYGPDGPIGPLAPYSYCSWYDGCTGEGGGDPGTCQ